MKDTSEVRFRYRDKAFVVVACVLVVVAIGIIVLFYKQLSPRFYVAEHLNAATVGGFALITTFVAFYLKKGIEPILMWRRAEIRIRNGVMQEIDLMGRRKAEISLAEIERVIAPRRFPAFANTKYIVVTKATRVKFYSFISGFDDLLKVINSQLVAKGKMPVVAKSEDWVDL